MTDEADTATPAQQAGSRNSDGTFARGHSGNPAGTPKGRVSFRAIARRLLAEAIEEGGKTAAEAVVEGWLADALAGDKDARKLLIEQIDGKAVAAIEMSGPDGVPLEVDLRRLGADDLATLERILGPR